MRQAVFVFAAATAALLCSAITAQAQFNLSKPVQISSDMDATGEPQVAVTQNGTLYVVWSNQANACTASSCSKDVLFSRSTDQGSTFSTPVNLSNSGAATTPLIAVDPTGAIDVVWSGGGHLFFTRSTDSGATFSSPLNIAGLTNASLAFCAAGYRPLIVDPAGNINVVWVDANTNQIFFARSANGGASFSSSLNISNYAPGASNPTMATDLSGKIDVLWQGSVAGHNPNDLFFTQSIDGGTSFSIAKDISNTPAGAFFDQIGVDPAGNIDVAWNSDCPSVSFCSVVSSDVFFTQSKDGGASFSPPVQLTNTQNQAAISRVLMAIDTAGNLNLAWPEVTGGSNAAFFSRLNSGATAFSSPRQIAATFPAEIAVDANGAVDLAAAGTDVYLFRSTDGGATFSSSNITNGGAGNNPKQVELVNAADGAGDVLIAWPGYNYNTAKWNIFGSAAAQTSAIGSQPSPSAAPGFTLAASPSALTIAAPGLSATTTLTITSKGGLAGTGALSSSACGTPSAKLTCTLTGFSLPANGSATAQLTVTSAASSAATSSTGQNLTFALLLCLALLPLALPRKPRRLNLAFAALAFAVMLANVGCSGTMTANNAASTPSSNSSSPSSPSQPKSAVQSLSVPITISGTTVTVPNLTVTLK